MIISENCLFLQFAMLESSSVDDDLANLKKELAGSSKVCFKQQIKCM
jgi:hypothetical protein